MTPEIISLASSSKDDEETPDSEEKFAVKFKSDFREGTQLLHTEPTKAIMFNPKPRPVAN